MNKKKKKINYWFVLLSALSLIFSLGALGVGIYGIIVNTPTAREIETNKNNGAFVKINTNFDFRIYNYAYLKGSYMYVDNEYFYISEIIPNEIDLLITLNARKIGETKIIIGAYKIEPRIIPMTITNF